LLLVDIDTAGLAPGDYIAHIRVRQTGDATPESLLVPVRLSVTTEVCECPCHGEPAYCDGLLNIADLVKIIGIAFRGQLAQGHVTCPVFHADVTCDCAVDILDVVRYVDYIWRSGPPLCDPCKDLVSPCILH